MRFTLALRDVDGQPVSGTRVTVTVTGADGYPDRRPTIVAAPDSAFDVPDTARYVAIETSHDRYASDGINLMRQGTEWRWTAPAAGVRGTAVTLVLTRVRPVNTTERSQADLTEMARRARAAADARTDAAIDAARARGVPADKRPQYPEFLPADENFRAMLTEGSGRWYRYQHSLQRVVAGFHLAQPALLAPQQTSRPGWARFVSSTSTVDPEASGQFLLVQYGEVGDRNAGGPRFLIGLWIPQSVLASPPPQLDAILWLHPMAIGNPALYPQEEYPFGHKYPYALWAQRTVEDAKVHYDISQRFPGVPLHHAYTQHYLAHALIAARRRAVLVIPVAPSGHVAPFVTPGPLHRMLRELLAWLPRLMNRSGQFGVFTGVRPDVRNVVAAGFSSSVPNLGPLLGAGAGDMHYSGDAWQGTSSATLLQSALKEVWAIDGIAKGSAELHDALAGFALSGPGRRVCIYKSTFTGWWDPWVDGGRFAGLTRGVPKPPIVTDGKARAWAAADPQGRWFGASMTTEFLSPGAAEQPAIEAGKPHEMMPRICFGHAVASSRNLA
ncbi:hypothetical protein [Dactylosporangium matsuzakiense]|uniref:Uncharacterized protein n=1 Tax=Dactylosporangium matsuzakiense TaxID=53360 RepID=A0A9W6KME2_9ACTN|nr:hypothetical protein [Dactylosporangium matsuzakiense]GLL02855.1 hypothetical protein GCM10017581_045970 [Dactylosporangium matsuzakiense]